MSKPSRRPHRAEIKAQRRKRKQQHKALRERQLAEGRLPRTPPPLPNPCSAYATILQEQQAREEAVSGQLCASCVASCPSCSHAWRRSPTSETCVSAGTS